MANTTGETAEGKGGARAPLAPGPRGRGGSSLSLKDLALRLLGLGFIDSVALWFSYTLVGNGVTIAAIVLLVVTALVNWVFISDRLYPVRWLAPGLVLMLLMVVYPLAYTVYIAFTNYSDGHILTREQVVAQLESQYFQPPDAVVYKWTAYRSPEGSFRLLLQDDAGNAFLAGQEEGLEPYPLAGAQELPESIGEYSRLDRIQSVQYLGQLQALTISDGDHLVRITSLDAAPQSVRAYSYDLATGRLTDNRTGVEYTPVRGSFTAPDGTQLTPGFAEMVGFENFLRVLEDPNIRGPFLGVFVWTLVFGALSVLLTFGVGLGLALVLNDNDLPLRGLFRSLAIVPYTIPGFISALVWVGLLNPYYGPFNLALESLIGVSPPWFSDGTLAKVAILLVNTWLGFPYMMLLCLGALQSIPSELHEAAELDGAGGWHRFRHITLPLLLVSVGPLLIGAFAFNFNNFAVIDLVTEGNPPIAGANTPAGQTDILISYTYRLAFAGGRGTDYALASTIAIFIFVIVASITAFNFRYTRQLEEVMG